MPLSVFHIPVHWLGIVALLLNDVEAHISTFQGQYGLYTETLEGDATSNASLVMDSLQEPDRTDATFSEPGLASMSNLAADTADSNHTISINMVSPEGVSQSGLAQEGVAGKPAQPQNGKWGRILHNSAFITGVLLSIACLGLLATGPLPESESPSLKRSLQARGAKGQEQKRKQKERRQHEQQAETKRQQEKQEKTQEDQQAQGHKEQEVQQPKGEIAGEGKVLMQELEEMEKLDTLLAKLNKTLRDADNRVTAASQDLRSCLENVRQVQQKLLDGSFNPGESPENEVRNILNKTALATSRLYEATRQQGLWQAKRGKSIAPPPVLSSQELEAFDRVSPAVADPLSYQMENLMYSFHSSMQQIPKIHSELKMLPESVEGNSKLRLMLSVVGADAAFLEGAVQAAQAGRRAIVELLDSATTLMVSHVTREQTNIYRECRDRLGEWKILSSIERLRHQSHPQENAAATLAALDEIDTILKEGGQLLGKHKGEIEDLKRQMNIGSAQEASERAGCTGEKLTALLEAVASRMSLIPGIAGTTEGVSNPEVKRAVEEVASRAQREAATAFRRAAFVLKGKLDRGISQLLLSRTKQAQGNAEALKNRLTNSWILERLQRSLEAVERQLERATQSRDAAAESEEDSDDPVKRMKKLVENARKADAEAEALLKEGELVLLQLQLLESLEIDVQLSVSIAHRAAALTQLGQHEEAVDPSRKQHTEALMKQVMALKEAARMQTELKGLASTAAALRAAAIHLVTACQADHRNRVRTLLT
ncbi:hypothetical protein, conserved [Eimeria praecox]|uniref:Myosin heavy chain n=1 Tax=Eimeria praecox TaxID=51316 RepID=U6G3S3_9EIME|nr:hypothetical protein, conserved [Eimeria praecox]